MKKMNNKGFSLVELIVVVLIMAIIAVALAPQVMKWVENSRLSTDCETYDQMISNLQLALTDKSLGASITGHTFTITNGSNVAVDGTEVKGETSGSSDKLLVALDKVNTSWYTAKAKVTSGSYVITVTADKQVKRTTPPDTSSNADLS